MRGSHDTVVFVEANNVCGERFRGEGPGAFFFGDVDVVFMWLSEKSVGEECPILVVFEVFE